MQQPEGKPTAFVPELSVINSQGEIERKKASAIWQARQAFIHGDYQKLYTLLEPIVSNDQIKLTKDEQKQVLPWYAAGLIVVAQQEKSVKQRQIFYDQARNALIKLLENNPSYQLEELLYPEQVVVLFKSIAGTLRHNNEPPQNKQNQTTVVYIQKEVTQNRFPLVFLPFGIGQFQNGDLVAGTLFASIQVAALVTNISSYLVIESLRGSDGFYSKTDYARAIAWRTSMYTSLGTFIAAYLASVIDGWVHFKEYNINIRTLEGPPPELIGGKKVAELNNDLHRFALHSYFGSQISRKNTYLPNNGNQGDFSLGWSIGTTW